MDFTDKHVSRTPGRRAGDPINKQTNKQTNIYSNNNNNIYLRKQRGKESDVSTPEHSGLLPRPQCHLGSFWKCDLVLDMGQWA